MGWTDVLKGLGITLGAAGLGAATGGLAAAALAPAAGAALGTGAAAAGTAAAAAPAAASVVPGIVGNAVAAPITSMGAQLGMKMMNGSQGSGPPQMAMTAKKPQNSPQYSDALRQLAGG